LSKPFLKQNKGNDSKASLYYRKKPGEQERLVHPRVMRVYVEPTWGAWEKDVRAVGLIEEM